jgi:hypothetical protein
MKPFLRTLGFWFILFCIAPVMALAQNADCPQIVQQALDAADQACQSTGRNQACYGNIDLTAQPQPDVPSFSFNKVGDVVDVADLQSLVLSPMDESAGKWGVALLRLQADIPDTLPGQNVTFLLFGDVEIDNAVAPDDTTQHPMQAFYLRTGTNDSPCDEAPESGLLVQTPEGVEEVTFNVNGVDVQMGSTVLFQADADNGMTVSTLEGAAFVAVDDGVQLIPPGASSLIQLGRQLRASGAPGIPTSYEGKLKVLRALPLRLLQRRIELAQPLTKEQVDLMRTKIQNGELPCGEAPLPRCTRLRTFLQLAVNKCMAMRPGDRPRFCSRLRNFIQKVNANLAAQNAITPIPLDVPGSG